MGQRRKRNPGGLVLRCLERKKRKNQQSRGFVSKQKHSQNAKRAGRLSFLSLRIRAKQRQTDTPQRTRSQASSRTESEGSFWAFRTGNSEWERKVHKARGLCETGRRSTIRTDPLHTEKTAGIDGRKVRKNAKETFTLRMEDFEGEKDRRRLLQRSPGRQQDPRESRTCRRNGRTLLQRLLSVPLSSDATFTFCLASAETRRRFPVNGSGSETRRRPGFAGSAERQNRKEASLCPQVITAPVRTLPAPILPVRIPRILPARSIPLLPDPLPATAVLPLPAVPAVILHRAGPEVMRLLSGP